MREALLAFYAKYYSANQMNLSLYSNWSLDEMQAVVAKYFSAIPNLNIEPIQHTEMPFGEQQLAKYIQVENITYYFKLFFVYIPFLFLPYIFR